MGLLDGVSRRAATHCVYHDRGRGDAIHMPPPPMVANPVLVCEKNDFMFLYFLRSREGVHEIRVEILYKLWEISISCPGLLPRLLFAPKSISWDPVQKLCWGLRLSG